MPCVDDEHAAVDGDRRHGGAARVEDDQVGLPLGGETRSVEQVRDEHLPGQAAAGAPAADRRQARERRELEMVGGGVAPGAGELDELSDRRRLFGCGRVRPKAGLMRIVQISDTHLSRDKPLFVDNWAPLAAWTGAAVRAITIAVQIILRNMSVSPWRKKKRTCLEIGRCA